MSGKVKCYGFVFNWLILYTHTYFQNILTPALELWWLTLATGYLIIFLVGHQAEFFLWSAPFMTQAYTIYRITSNKSHTLAGNKIVDHSDIR